MVLSLSYSSKGYVGGANFERCKQIYSFHLDPFHPGARILPFPGPNSFNHKLGKMNNAVPQARAGQCRSPRRAFPIPCPVPPAVLPFPHSALAVPLPLSRASCPHSRVACWLALFAYRALAVPIPLSRAGWPCSFCRELFALSRAG